MINPSMKRVPPKAKKKSKAKKVAAIRRLRGKYKHLDLMKELSESRKQDRQRDASVKNAENPARKATRKTKSKAKKAEPARKPRRKPTRQKGAARVKEEAGVYGVDLTDFVTLEAAAAASGKTTHNIRDYIQRGRIAKSIFDKGKNSQMKKQQLLKTAKKLSDKETYAVQIWTREDVQAAHDDLMLDGKVYEKDFENFEKDDILEEFERQSRDERDRREMNWDNLRKIIIDFSESRDELEIRMRYR